MGEVILDGESGGDFIELGEEDRAAVRGAGIAGVE